MREVFRVAGFDASTPWENGVEPLFSPSSDERLRLETLPPAVFLSTSLSTTSLPNDTVLRRVVAVPGVRRIPEGLVGEKFRGWKSLAFLSASASGSVSIS